jgi:hypothetical protein
MEELGFPHPKAWRLVRCIKTKLKIALPLNSNLKPSIPVAHSVAKKESY